MANDLELHPVRIVQVRIKPLPSGRREDGSLHKNFRVTIKLRIDEVPLTVVRIGEHPMQLMQETIDKAAAGGEEAFFAHPDDTEQLPF